MIEITGWFGHISKVAQVVAAASFSKACERDDVGTWLRIELKWNLKAELAQPHTSVIVEWVPPESLGDDLKHEVWASIAGPTSTDTFDARVVEGPPGVRVEFNGRIIERGPSGFAARANGIEREYIDSDSSSPG